MNYPWPGNVREMENVIEYALHLTMMVFHTAEQLPPALLTKSDAAWSPCDFVSIEEYIKQVHPDVADGSFRRTNLLDSGNQPEESVEKRKRWKSPPAGKSRLI